MVNKNIQIIAIDGPAGSGKGTVAKKLSRQLNYHYLDSGAIYRIIALACIKKNVAIENDGALSQLIQKVSVYFDGDNSLLENENVTEQIRDERVGKVASYIAQNINLRNSILDYQRSFAKNQV